MASWGVSESTNRPPSPPIGKGEFPKGKALGERPGRKGYKIQRQFYLGRKGGETQKNNKPGNLKGEQGVKTKTIWDRIQQGKVEAHGGGICPLWVGPYC